MKARICSPLHREARGKTDTPSPGTGTGWLMREDSVVMEDGLGMSERQSVRCWKVQGPGATKDGADCSVVVLLATSPPA